MRSWKPIPLLLLTISACALSPSPSSSQQPSSLRKYDGEIERAVGKWWSDLPRPMLWKAQLWQESLLNPDAVSRVGAAGLAQFMPATWAEVSKRLGMAGVSPHSARHAIEAGAYYMAKLRAGWIAKRPTLERHELALASYNAGMGSILKAQTRCAGARLWRDIAMCLPRVTGARNARETTGYVEKIMRRWWPQLEAVR